MPIRSNWATVSPVVVGNILSISREKKDRGLTERVDMLKTQMILTPEHRGNDAREQKPLDNFSAIIVVLDLHQI